MEVRIDGVLYVPVSEAHVDADRIIGTLIQQWWGDNWEEHRQTALEGLRVIVSDEFEDNEGETIPDFVARIIG